MAGVLPVGAVGGPRPAATSRGSSSSGRRSPAAGGWRQVGVGMLPQGAEPGAGNQRRRGVAAQEDRVRVERGSARGRRPWRAACPPAAGWPAARGSAGW